MAGNRGKKGKRLTVETTLPSIFRSSSLPSLASKICLIESGHKQLFSRELSKVRSFVLVGVFVESWKNPPPTCDPVKSLCCCCELENMELFGEV